MPVARIQVLISSLFSQRFSAYLPELLEQEGLHFARTERVPHPLEVDLLIRASDAPTLSEAEVAFLMAGGRLLAFALEQGPAGAARPLPPGHARIDGERLRFFEGRALPGADHAHGEAGEPRAPLVQELRVGAGTLLHLSVDVADTVVRLQQGHGPVERDLPSAPDGSAETEDGLLKADDGMTLDWLEDRRLTPGGQPYFAVAAADRWRRWLLQEIVRAVSPLPVARLAYWPAAAPAAFHLSLDSDGNDPAHAASTLAFLAGLGLRATWCELEGGYGPELQRAIHAAGHEVALHYNALEREGGRWGGDAFAAQLERHNAQAPARATSNKNHYTRFEGWDELFAWCDAGGITLDGTRGGSKMGNRGFVFGTCHPYRPARADRSGARHALFELGFLSQDMDLDAARWGDSSITGPLLSEVEAVSGCAHLLCHPAHLHAHAPVRDALEAALRLARARGFLELTACEIAAWSRARRATRLTPRAGGLQVSGAPQGAVLELLRVGSVRQIPLETPDSFVSLAQEAPHA
ncbi:hypothetical protein HNR42_000912 [Deinobacterium chartae]|uniref:Uncharacterized protein n=1 Tax=Deinobacterium chartae TaxID=521158 RepID=A0A841I0I7_9DEIO|nr:hypothetical protein [Deinobacterium chartae]MBB6097495.1 hypothetical protein [Deinobacterium chartae]